MTAGEMFEEYDYPDSGKVVFAMDQFIGETGPHKKKSFLLITMLI